MTVISRYEAARCPKVVVAQIDPEKLVSEQTPYMPDIPGIPACPSYLLPSKEWEDYFLGDFSLLRMVCYLLMPFKSRHVFPFFEMCFVNSVLIHSSQACVAFCVGTV